MDFYRFALTLALAAPPGAHGAALSTQWSLTSGDCPSDCHNRGACRGGRCYCVAGWGGKACDVKQCSVCAHGKCIDGECVCDAGFMGRQCRERTCPSDCHNHGACHDGVCVALQFCGVIRRDAENSSHVRSEKALRPAVHEESRALCAAMRSACAWG